MANDGDMAYWRYQRNPGPGRPTFSYVPGSVFDTAWQLSFVSSASQQSFNPGREFSAVRGASYAITLQYRISQPVSSLSFIVVDHADGSPPDTATADGTVVGTWETLTVHYAPRTDSLAVGIYVATVAGSGPLDVVFDVIDIIMTIPSPWSPPATLDSGAITLVDWRSGSDTNWANTEYFTNAGEQASINVPSGSITWSFDSPGYDTANFARRVSFNDPSRTGTTFSTRSEDS